MVVVYMHVFQMCIVYEFEGIQLTTTEFGLEEGVVSVCHFQLT